MRVQVLLDGGCCQFIQAPLESTWNGERRVTVRAPTCASEFLHGVVCLLHFLHAYGITLMCLPVCLGLGSSRS